MKEKNDVEKRMQLPEAVYKLLAGEGIQKEDILYKAEPDLDAELRFARNYLVMTKEVLVLCSYPYQAHGKFRFGGYAGNELAFRSFLKKSSPPASNPPYQSRSQSFISTQPWAGIVSSLVSCSPVTV